MPSIHKDKGFTLIELLVVIAIIALLLAIIAPSLRAAKELAGASVCLSNQKQIMIAWHVYAGENNDIIVGPDTNSESWVNRPFALDSSGNLVNVPMSACTAEDEQRGIAKGLLYPYYEDFKLVHCPTDKRSNRPPTMPGKSGDGAYRTYSFIDHAGYAGYPLKKPPLGVLTRISQIKTAGSKFVLVEENDNRGFNQRTWMMGLGTPPTFIDPFAVFHNMRSTLGFADAHAEKIVWKDEGTKAYSQRIDEGGEHNSRPEEHTDNEDLVWLKSHYARQRYSGTGMGGGR